MKRILALSVCLFLALFFACEGEEEKKGGIFSFEMGGEAQVQVWDLSVNQIAGLEKYYITVETGGGSGNAVISAEKVSEGISTQLGNFRVFKDAPILLSPLGPEIQFSQSAGGFNLAPVSYTHLTLPTN